MSQLDVGLAREFARQTIALRHLEEEVAAARGRLLAMETAVVDALVSAGVINLPIDVDGERVTVYVHRQLWARRRPELERADGVQALERAGLGWMVRQDWSASALSAWCRERRRDKQQLPEELQTAFVVSEDVGARVRRVADPPERARAEEEER